MAKRSRPDSAEKLRAHLEALAMQAVLAEDLDRSLHALKQVESEAARAGHPRLAQEASSLLAQLSQAAAGGQGGSPSPWEFISEGVLRLQQALEEANHDSAVASAGEPPPAPPEPERPAAESLPLARDPELVRDFVVESREHLTNIESSLLALEQDPANAESLHAAFRGFHTIKGLAGFLEFAAIQEVAHEVETLLDLARNQQLSVTPERIDVVLKAADYLKAAIRQVDASLDGRPLEAFADNCNLLWMLRMAATAAAEDSQAAGAAQTGLEDRQTSGPSASAAVAGSVENRAIKVDTEKLDHLVDMVGEMVIAQSMLRHDPDLALNRSPRLQRTLSLLSGITSDVQKTAMGLRMVTIGTLFRRMGRLVRDLARKTGKQVELVTAGEETELDRQIVEELADPIMHMLRNSIDHGIEPPEERAIAGKDPCGRITLAAHHQSGQIVIQISDDGRGLNREKILQRGRERGLIPPGVTPSEAELYNLIFEPGFSTAERVTEVSGRGVGMDVVKKNIVRMRGKVEVASQPGQGTTFTLKLPLTLAIIDGLVVGVGTQRYIIPIYSVVEMLCPSRDSVTTAPEQGEMVLVRGSLLPVIRLNERFGVEARAQHPSEGLLVVAEQEGKRFSVLVDEFIGKQEVVIKSLGPMFRHVRGIAGGAILGDGRVGLILDLEAIFAWKGEA
ncbi:MAG: chemotaxis protein CheA [Bryobacteraceae bacterium]|nr:chemotaxis protein CheA [Bryobacteraceae bacterium]